MSFESDNDDEIDTTEIEEEDWVDYIRGTEYLGVSYLDVLIFCLSSGVTQRDGGSAA